MLPFSMACHGNMPRGCLISLFRSQLDVSCQAILGDPPARLNAMIVWLLPSATVVRAKPPPERSHLPLHAAVLPRPMLDMDDDRRQGGLGRTGRGGEHMGASVERLPLRAGNCENISSQ